MITVTICTGCGKPMRQVPDIDGSGYFAHLSVADLMACPDWASGPARVVGPGLGRLICVPCGRDDFLAPRDLVTHIAQCPAKVSA